MHTEAETTLAVPFGSTNGTTARTVVELALSPNPFTWRRTTPRTHSVKKCVSAPEPTSTIGISPRRTLLRNLMTSFAGDQPTVGYPRISGHSVSHAPRLRVSPFQVTPLITYR